MKRLLALIAVMAMALAACGGGGDGNGNGGGEYVGDAAAGEAKFVTCAACHGPDATGLPNLGKDLTNSEFLAGMTDAEVVAFLEVGRRADDPANDTGVDMPPKGGDPSLSEFDLYDIVAYLRTLPGN